VQHRDDIVGLDAAVIMSQKVWEASGDLEVFHDPLVECLTCHQRYREDHLPDPPVCPNCGGKGFTDPRAFNLMFSTHMGPVPDDDNRVFLRPETAQAPFVDFTQIQTVSRKKIPFGIAQIGKSFRNEITPGTSSSGCGSSSRWRWSSSSSRAPTSSGTSTGSTPGNGGTSTSGSSPSTSGCANTAPTS
jgi:glycyl-tRNA synthetase